MDATEIRALYVETIARAFYNAESEDEEATTGSGWIPWESLDEAGRWRCGHDARLAVDALAETGLLPAAEERRYIGQGDRRRTRLVTDWKDPE